MSFDLWYDEYLKYPVYLKINQPLFQRLVHVITVCLSVDALWATFVQQSDTSWD